MGVLVKCGAHERGRVHIHRIALLAVSYRCGTDDSVVVNAELLDSRHEVACPQSDRDHIEEP